MSAQKNINKSSGASVRSYSHKKNNVKGKHNDLNRNYYIYLAIPLYLIIAIVPLIVYVKEIVSNGQENANYDIFSYYKMVFLLIFTGIGLLFYLMMKKGSPFDNSKRPYYITTGIFAFFTLISSITSDYKQVAFYGGFERYEGALVLLAYCVILFLSLNILQSEKSIIILFYCLFASSVIISILGVFQYFGINYFDSDVISRLMTPPSLQGSIRPKIEGNLIYSTLYNPDYVGSYMAMIIPMQILLLVWVKKTWQKLVAFFALLLAAINLIGSSSRAGMVSTGFAILVLFIIFRRNIWAHKWIAISVALVLTTGFMVFNFATHGSVIKRLASMATLENKVNMSASQEALDKALVGLSDVKMDDKKLQLITNKGVLNVSVDNLSLKVSDENSNDITMVNNGNSISFTDKRFENIKIDAKPEQGIMGIYYNGYHLMDVALTEIGLLSPTNKWLADRKDRAIEAFGFEGMESLGSNRGYIWSRTLPLLKNTIIIGHGPDTYPFYFPQYDFLGKLRFYQNGGIGIDKPHNLYLQTAFDTGVLSLLALLALFTIYFISSVRIYLKGISFKDDFLPVAGVICFTAFCGYAAAALFNDSVVSVAPVFWVLFGLGIGINVKMGKETTSIRQG